MLESYFVTGQIAHQATESGIGASDAQSQTTTATTAGAPGKVVANQTGLTPLTGTGVANGAISRALGNL